MKVNLHLHILGFSQVIYFLPDDFSDFVLLRLI